MVIKEADPPPESILCLDSLKGAEGSSFEWDQFFSAGRNVQTSLGKTCTVSLELHHSESIIHYGN